MTAASKAKGGPSRAPRRAERIFVERVTPAVDGGRYASKRVVGDTVAVGADVIKDGHDRFTVRLRFRRGESSSWSYAPMQHDLATDRWHAAFVVDQPGGWQYSVEACDAPYETWSDGLLKKFAAAQDVSLELREGALLLEAAAGRARGDTRSQLRELAAHVTSEDALLAERVARATAADVRAVMVENSDYRQASAYPLDLALVVEPVRALCGAWYELFPRSCAQEPGRHGTFADAAQQLPRLARLGFDVLYLPPIHPIGTTFRKGPNNSLVAGPNDPGSPWAIGNAAGGHTAVEPKLGTLADFDRFVAAARDLGIDIALDYALQCSPDHPWVSEHPGWFHIRPDGSIQYAENPPKKYQDIYPLHFWCDDRQALWEACRDIVLFWVDHGVRIFRVDNPHTKPLAFWEWMIADVRRSHPEVIFLSEAFTHPKRLATLAKLGFSQSYGYFTWRTAAHELRTFVEELAHGELAEFHRPNFFANTPDILHESLQTGGRAGFLVRLLLAATLSPTYGIYSGFELCENVAIHPGSEEYLDSEKYQLRQRDWSSPGNLDADIARINQIRRERPALQRLRNVSFLTSENDAILFFHKGGDGDDLLIAINLDPWHAQESMVHVPLARLGLGADAQFEVEDLLTGAHYTWRGSRNYVRLDPQEQVAHVLRLLR